MGVELELRSGVGPSSNRSKASRVWDQAHDLIRSVLVACETRGNFILRVREQVQMRGDEKIRLKYAVGQAIKLTVKPGDNNTAWNYDLIPPGDVDASLLCNKLKTHLLRSGELNLSAEEDDATVLPPPTTTLNGLEPPIPATPAAAVVPEVKTAVATPPRSLLSRVSELETRRQRLADRQAEMVKLDEKRAALMTQMAAIDAESLKLIEEDQADTDAYEAKEILENLERLFSRT